MPTYLYKLVTKENKIVEGTVSAFTQARAKAQLAREQEDATVLMLRVDASSSSIFYRPLALPAFGFSKPEQIHFFRNLATMVAAGLSIADSLRVLQEQAANPGLKKAVGAMTADIENGQKLSRAMKKFPSYFSEFLYETVSVGEITGKLGDILDHISVDLEHDYELTRKVRGAMAYPFIVILVMVAVVVGLTVFVLPKIADLFNELDAALPLPTRILLGSSAYMRSHPFSIVGMCVVFIGAVYAAWRNRKSRYLLHFLILKVPVFGELAREFNLARFFRALESLFTSGVSLVKSVDIAKKTLKNDVYRKALDEAHLMLLHGSPLTEVLKTHPELFPLQTQRIVEVGERTGKLEEIFKRITDYYERALRHKTQMLASLIEPILILFIGIVVGGIALSVFLPIYQISSIL